MDQRLHRNEHKTDTHQVVRDQIVIKNTKATSTSVLKIIIKIEHKSISTKR